MDGSLFSSYRTEDWVAFIWIALNLARTRFEEKSMYEALVNNCNCGDGNILRVKTSVGFSRESCFMEVWVIVNFLIAGG